MEILTPSSPAQPAIDRLTTSPSSSLSSSLSQEPELEQQPSLASRRLAEISEEKDDDEEEENVERREKVYVAVGRNVEKTLSLIRWSIRMFRSSDICFVHVHLPSPLIPTLLGNLPANRASPEVVAAYRRCEQEKMKELLHYYLKLCHQVKVKASFISSEAEKVHNGLVDLVLKHGIQKLVMGSFSQNFVKLTTNSSKASYAAKMAPAFCEIWFVNKGKHVWTREAFEVARLPSGSREEKSSLQRPRSKSYQDNTNDHLHTSDHLQFGFSTPSLLQCDTEEWVQNGHTKEDLLLSHASYSPVISYNPCIGQSSKGNYSASFPSSKRRIFSDSDAKLDEECLYALLLEVKTEAEVLKNNTFAKVLKREKLEAEAIQSIMKVKDIELIHSRETKLRMEAEDALRSMMDEQDRLSKERLDVTREFQKTTRNVAILDSRIQEGNRQCEEVAEEVKLIQVCIPSLQQEKQMIQRQRMEADRWLERWRNRRRTGGTNRQRNGGLLDDLPELIEFSLIDLQSATCNFSESFKICERGSFSVYKGELLGRTISIQRLHAYNIQAPESFQKEVEVLGKLRHPHLINLIGSCPQAWSLVYDYVPANLQIHLFPKSNIAPLSWKIRARIISELSAALLFLHSSYPEKIVHGDLRPENILLDLDLHCKLRDFGISRLMSQDTLRCPSFGRFPESRDAIPYTDPEFHRAGTLSPKSDVYSFGVVMLQLLTGRSTVGLVARVRGAVSTNRLASILDPSAGNWEPSVAKKLADLALKFCEPHSRDRPELTPSLVKELQLLHMSEEQPVPYFFTCPILQEVMCDPQVAADGFTYEGRAIQTWLENGSVTSPMTNLELDHLHLTPNHSLRLAIHEWLCKY
ncbi:hypothetical protein vseg_021073 [Gypsophila vaccaria]